MTGVEFVPIDTGFGLLDNPSAFYGDDLNGSFSKIQEALGDMIYRDIHCVNFNADNVCIVPILIPACYTKYDPETDQFFYHSDHLGSSSFITNINGAAVQHLQYLPFGETYVDQRHDSPYNTPYRFSGKEKDDETQYSYFGARYYDSDLSVWLSVDPLADKYPGMSPFMYCGGNPVVYKDIKGMDIDPTDDNSKKSLDKYINTFSTKKKTGTDLFGVTIDKDGLYSSTLNMKPKEFAKYAKKQGLTGEQLKAAINFYKYLNSSDVTSIRTISVGESEHDFNNKEQKLSQLSDFKDLPLFVRSYTGMAELNIATENSINSCFSKSLGKGENFAFFSSKTFDSERVSLIIKHSNSLDYNKVFNDSFSFDMVIENWGY